MSEKFDQSTLAQAVDGDREAFGALYERYVNQIYSYIYYRTGNAHDAEDLTERVFMRALRHIGKYSDRGLPFTSWLYRIAHNLVANWHRDNSRRKEIPLDDLTAGVAHGEHPESSVMRSEEQATLLGHIRRLPPDRQQLLILKFVEGLSNAEIGQIMGKTEGAIKSLYHRTLLTLRDEIGEAAIFIEDQIEPEG